MCSIINIEYERQADHKLYYRKRFNSNRGDLFSNMPVDDSNFMLVDEFEDIIKNEPDLEKADMDTMASDFMFDTKNSFECISVRNDGFDTIIDPNDFLCDAYKSEVDHSSTFSTPNRSTPSPTTSNSSQSSDLLSVDYNSASNLSEASINLYNSQNNGNYQQYMQQYAQKYHLDTPPISPPSDTAVNKMPYIQPAQSIPMLNQIVTTTPTDSNNQINIIQGTLIPITAVSLTTPQNGTNINSTNSMKKIKIQPKPLAIAIKPNQTKPINHMTNSNFIPKPITTPKRIVLSGSDYKSLVLKCKTQSTTTATPAPVMTVQANDANILKFVQTNATNTVPSVNSTSATMKLNSPSMITTNIPNNRIQITSLSGQQKKPKQKIIQNDIDDRALKKQLRMIKNRESACLSRKRKKDYVTTLESRLMDLSKENQELKTENMALKEIKERLLGQWASKMCDKCNNLLSETGSKGIETISIMRSVTKKNAAFLLAFVFMVSLNVGPYISPNLGNYPDAEKSLSVPQHHVGARGLLWIDDDNDNSNITTNIGDGIDSDRMYPMCPVSVNQSESIRLATELQRWIGDLPEYFNLTKDSTKSNDDLDLSKISEFLLSDKDNAVIKSFYKQMRKISNGIETQKRERRPLMKRRYQNGNDQDNVEKSITSNDYGKHVQIFSPAYSNAMKYATFFEEIHRQDDTFYVVSFRADHLLLPALAHNKTFRPKMSLMLPAWNLNNNNNASTDGIVTLMQIDCEVLNTSMIRIKESSIPDNLRNRSSASMPNRNTENPVVNETLKPRKMKYRRQNIPATGTEPTVSDTEKNEITSLNNTDINNGFESSNLNEYDSKKDTVKNYKPYFLRNQAERNIGN